MELPEIVTKEIGPLPAWGWAVAGIGGFVLSRKLGGLFGGGSEKAPATPAGSPDAGDTGSGATGVPGDGFGGYGYAGGLGGASWTTGTSNVGQLSDPVIQTNDEWRAKVVAALAKQGYAALVVDSALTRYLAGEQLDQTAAAIVDRAISSVGFPPNPPTLVPSVVAPSQNPSPQPGKVIPALGAQTYLVRPDDGDIAIFLTDYAAIRWIADGNEVDALGKSGQVHSAGVVNGTVQPYAISRSRLDGLAKIGGPPQYPSDYKGPRTVW